MTAVPAPRAPRAAASLALLVTLAALAAGSPPCLAQEHAVEEREGNLVSVFSGDLRVPAGVQQYGNVVAIGGDLEIEGRVDGDVVAIFGTIKIRGGSVDGNVTGVLSDLTLERAEVMGSVVDVGGDLEVRDSRVDGEMVNVLGSLERDAVSRATGQIVNIGFASLWTILFWLRLFHKFLVFVLLLFLLALVPDRLRVMADEAAPRYLPALGVGLVGYLVAFLLLNLLLVTIIGAPAFLLVFFVLKWMGIAALFHALGRRLGRAFGLSLSLAASVLLAFALYAALFLAPAALGLVGLLVLAVLKVLFFLLVAAPALGLVILTRAGSSVPRARGASAAVVVPAPTAPAAGP